MESHLLELLRIPLAILSGALIGYAFGLIQNAAWRKHTRQEIEGNFKNAWSIMPGSGSRIAGLLLGLVAVQIVCPLIFVDGTQWLVSGGLVAGYGVVLYKSLRQRMAAGI